LLPLPERSLLCAYADKGAYTDCYAVDVIGPVSTEQFVEAFLSSRLFKVERFILKWLVAKPSTDAQAKHLAAGSLDHFAAWNFEGRSADQLLMCDYQGRTRLWLMVSPNEDGTNVSTRLFFGTAVVPDKNRRTGAQSMPPAFRALVGFHRLYAQGLLRSAVSRLERGPPVSSNAQTL
jgi:hypothetical protein